MTVKVLRPNAVHFDWIFHGELMTISFFPEFRIFFQNWNVEIWRKVWIHNFCKNKDIFTQNCNMARIFVSRASKKSQEFFLHISPSMIVDLFVEISAGLTVYWPKSANKIRKKETIIRNHSNQWFSIDVLSWRHFIQARECFVQEYAVNVKSINVNFTPFSKLEQQE